MRLIDADALKEHIIQLFKDEEVLWFDSVFIGAIDNAPTIEWKDIEFMGYVNGKQITKIKPSKIEGHWEEIMRDFGYRCSICHYVGFKTNYCPNCGARMNP